MSPIAEVSVEKDSLLLGVKCSKESISGKCDPFNGAVVLAEACVLLTLSGGHPPVFVLNQGQGLWPIPSGDVADGCGPSSPILGKAVMLVEPSFCSRAPWLL